MTPLTPADRGALVARAKSLAVPVTSCVAARIPPAHLIGDMTRDELAALVIVLAEAVDPVRLRAVAAAGEDEEDPEDERLRQAHAKAMNLRRMGRPVPMLLRAAENDYHKRRRAEREAAA